MKKIFFLLASVTIMHGAFTQKIIRDTVLFDFGTSFLSAKEKASLSGIIKRVKNSETCQITLKGHTDSIGGFDYNDRLSEKRVAAVKNYLVSCGLDRNCISTGYYGENKPVVSNSDEDNRKLNRRVEIIARYEPVIASVEYVIEEAPEVVKKEREPENFQTVVRDNNGVEIIVNPGTFSPFKDSDVSISIKSALTIGDAIEKGWYTSTYGGGCLSTGGMISVTAYYNGKEVQPNGTIPVKIRIPTGDINKAMQVYRMYEDTTGNSGWDLSSLELGFDEFGNKFYEFETTMLSEYNIDKMLKTLPLNDLPPVLSEAVRNMDDEGLLVRNRRYNCTKSLLVSRKESMIVGGKHLKQGSYAFIPCSVRPDVEYIAVFRKGDRTYMVRKPLEEIAYRPGRKSFVVRSRDYERVSNRKVKEMFASL